MVFVRLAGCSVGCPGCDTNYRVARRVTIEALLVEIQAAIPAHAKRPWVWITGGEPTDHDIVPLIDCLHTLKLPVALATSGVRPAPNGLEWLSVSPHSVDAKQRNGHEVKAVPGLNGLSWEDIEEIGRWSFPYRYVQPLDGTPPDECVRFVLSHPGWRLGIQAHKVWNVA
jgi:7-carboxy-7-deazaguanine synthase